MKIRHLLLAVAALLFVGVIGQSRTVAQQVAPRESHPDVRALRVRPNFYVIAAPARTSARSSARTAWCWWMLDRPPRPPTRSPS